MLKKRIIPVQLLLNDRLVKTVQFDSYRDVGNPITSSKVYSSQDADELVFLNIDRTSRSIEPLLRLIKNVAEVCFMPLALGGGITRFQEAVKLIQSGADKVVLNSICYSDFTIIQRIADNLGSQAIVASIDARWEPGKGDYQLYSNCGRNMQYISLEEHIQNVIKCGAGEILINSIDRDGMMNGYDLVLIDRAIKASSVPVIGCGGAGTFIHIRDAFLETRVSALACGSLFNFGDNNPIRAKAFLKNYDIPLKII